MDRVSAVAQGLHHLQDRDFATEPREEDAQFYAHQTTAEDEHFFSDPLRMQVGLLCTEDVLAVYPGDLRSERACAQSSDDDVDAGGLCDLRGHRSAEAHVDGRAGDHPGLMVEIVREQSLERYSLLAAEYAAETLLFLAEDDLVPPLRCGQRCLHPGHAAPHHEDGLGSRGRQRVSGVLLEADLGIHRTPVLTLRRGAREAFEATDAGPDLFRPAAAGLLGPVGIGHQGTGGQHDVGLAGGDYLFHEFRIAEGPDGRHWSLDVLLDLRRKGDVDPVRQEHARMGDGEHLLHLVAAGRDVDQVDLPVELLSRWRCPRRCRTRPHGRPTR